MPYGYYKGSISLPASRDHEIMHGQINIKEGALAEDFVAAELAKKGYSRKHELDFLLPENDGVHIVEVKSGDNYKSHASLNYAMEHESERVSRATLL